MARTPRPSARERLAAFDGEGRDARFARYVSRFDEVDQAVRSCIVTEVEAEAVMAAVLSLSPRRRGR